MLRQVLVNLIGNAVRFDADRMLQMRLGACDPIRQPRGP
jgi:C4-dicarboxylate-specific signal transduction histidine kinase